MQGSRFTPAVPRPLLLFVSGLMWSLVGIMLCRMAWLWIFPLGMPLFLAPLFIGAAGACVVFYFGFSRIAQKNIDRLCRLPERACFFAFQAWKSYLIIAFMIALGLTLRHSSIPKFLLAVVYFIIGGGLFLSSFRYYLSIYTIVHAKSENFVD